MGTSATNHTLTCLPHLILPEWLLPTLALLPPLCDTRRVTEPAQEASVFPSVKWD